MLSATRTLSTAKDALELLKRGIGGVADASAYIVRNDLDAVLAINSASFTADLNAATGGQVMMDLSLTYRGSSMTRSLSFNFNDPLSSAQALGRQLVG